MGVVPILATTSSRSIGMDIRVQSNKSNKRSRDADEDSELSIVPHSVKRQAAKLLQWTINPNNAKEFGFDTADKFDRVLSHISKLPDERKVSNPYVNLSFEAQPPKTNSIFSISGSMKLSEFLTLCAARHEITRYSGFDSFEISFAKMKPDGFEENDWRSADDFDYDEIIEIVDHIGGVVERYKFHLDAGEHQSYIDFETLVGWRILEARDPFFPSQTPLKELKVQAGALWKTYWEKRKQNKIYGGPFSAGMPDDKYDEEILKPDPSIKALLESMPEDDRGDLLKRAKAWWKMTPE